MTLRSPGRKPITVTRATWWDAVEAIQSTEVNGLSPVLSCVKQMDLCPAGIVNQESMELIRMFNATQGIKNLRTPSEYLALPAYWVAAVEIIESERAVYGRLKAASSDGQE